MTPGRRKRANASATMTLELQQRLSGPMAKMRAGLSPRRVIARAQQHEPLRTLHPPSRRDIAADDRDHAGGLAGFLYLPLSALPEVDYPTIQVQTFLPGASPDVMTTSVTAPLERQFGEMPGLQPDDIDELGRRIDHYPAIRSEPQ